MRWEEHIARMGATRNSYMLTRKVEVRKPLRRPSRRWEDNIKMGLKYVGFEGMNWLHLAKDREQW
jgi:hypothetical protein